MRKIAVTNQKGGVGKSLSVMNLSHALAFRGQRVLMVDTDPQSILTGIFIRDLVEMSTYDLMTGTGAAGDYAQEIRPGLYLIPANPRLAGIESIQGKERELLLKRAMAKLRGYNFVIIDCPPSLGLLTVNALAYAEKALVPVKTDYLSLQGLVKINDLIEIVRDGINPRLGILGYLPCQFDGRRILDREVLALLKKRFKKVFPPIRQNISLGESPSWGQTIFEYKKDSKGAADYAKLASAIMKS